jgi:hypothetical protein
MVHVPVSVDYVRASLFGLAVFVSIFFSKMRGDWRVDAVRDGKGRGPGRTSRVEGFIGTEEETKRGKAGRGLYSDGETTRRKK